jgi:hypothetical protein
MPVNRARKQLRELGEGREPERGKASAGILRAQQECAAGARKAATHPSESCVSTGSTQSKSAAESQAFTALTTRRTVTSKL